LGLRTRDVERLLTSAGFLRAIGLDEYARRKGHRSNTVIVDVDRGKPLMTLKGRGAADVVAWCKRRPQDERARVDVVVLDRSKTYASARKELCGESVHVIERFHVVPLAVNARDAVLRSV
jgi:transposase